MSYKLSYHYAAERPTIQLWILNAQRELMDLSTGYTFSFRVGGTYASPLLTKTSGITGAVGSGVEPSGTPNVVISWSAGEITAGLGSQRGTYPCWLTLTTGTADDIRTGTFKVTE